MIFGLEQPQIKIGEEIIVLNFSNMQPDFMTPLFFEYVSPFNGDKNFIYLGDYAQFRIQINLFETASHDALFAQLKGLEEQLVIFYPHKDGAAIKDKFGNDILFFVNAVTPFYLNNENEFDMIELTFSSVGFVDYTGVYNILGFGYQFSYNYGFGV